MERFIFKGNLGDFTDQIITRAKKKSQIKLNIEFIFNFY